MMQTSSLNRENPTSLPYESALSFGSISNILSFIFLFFFMNQMILLHGIGDCGIYLPINLCSRQQAIICFLTQTLLLQNTETLISTLLLVFISQSFHQIINQVVACPLQPDPMRNISPGYRLTFVVDFQFDIPTLDVKGATRCPGIIESYNMVKNWVENEIKQGIDPKHIVILGFSQGGALGLFSSI